jgi:predicted metalloprotease with PDZ domain
MIRDFSRHIFSIQAESRSGTLSLVKHDKQSWLLEGASEQDVCVTYRIYAWDRSVRAAHLDTTHAYFNGPAVFLGVKGREMEPCEVEILRPEGAKYAAWRVAVSMGQEQVDDAGFGRYLVSDYESLLDHPVEMSDFDASEFQVGEIPHRFVVYGQHSADLGRICSDLAKICRQAATLFGELPVQEYLFLLWVVGNGYGGLEHHNSSSLMIDRDALPAKSMRKITPGYRRLLGLCSHEYLHLWNVKRITPEVFLRHGTAQEVYTRQLWIFEGITSYYDDLMLLRSGVIETKDYFELLADCVTRVMRGAGRLKQTLEESSFDAWTKFYKQDENAPNAIVSYYSKGALVALMLDLTIRMRSDGSISLDDVMRALWQRYGKTNLGLPEGAFERLVEEFTGFDFKPEFDRWLRSTEELQLGEIMRSFGVELHLLPAKSPTDMGSVAETRPGQEPRKLVLGAKWKQQGSGILLQQVFDEGAAQIAGLSAGDEIIAVDGLRLEAANLESYLEQRSEEAAPVSVHAFRGDELMRFDVQPLPAPDDTCCFYLPADIDQRQARLRDGWLSGNANRN